MNLGKKIKNTIKGFLNKMPYIKSLYRQSMNCCHPNGHFYSPVFSIEDIKNRESEIWKNRDVDGINGIELRTEIQKKLILELSKYYGEMPFKTDRQQNVRFHFKNGYYSYTDGIILYSIIRHFKPKQIIEIGSGFSSAVMLDTNEFFFENTIDLTFIEPYPERLFSLIKKTDSSKITVIEKNVQRVELDMFNRLEAGDILFIDSTHVSKTGSDVNYIFFEILPILKKGVLIHFHDVFYPFEYPKDWAFRGINWNEDYILKAFLMYNDKFQINLFSEYLHQHHKEVFADMPLCYKCNGSNIWIEKK